MKTAPKVLLLIFGLAQLGVVLYLCVPTIPTKIQNEAIGTEYTFNNMSFDLLRTDLNLPNQETLAKIQEKTNGDLFVLTSEDNEQLIIMKSDENTSYVEELLSNIQNPFKHRKLEWETQTLFWLFQGKDKIVSQSVIISDMPIFVLDMKLKDSYYTANFSGNRWTDEDIEVFIRTLSLNN